LTRGKPYLSTSACGSGGSDESKQFSSENTNER
jgi:hypothetical protein